MHIISRKALREFWTLHPDSEQALKSWYHEVKVATWETSAELTSRYPAASVINAKRVVFNIRGNNYRLIVEIHYGRQMVFIRFVGTHSEYDKIDAKEI
jgi:mRNA interferase HigB